MSRCGLYLQYRAVLGSIPSLDISHRLDCVLFELFFLPLLLLHVQLPLSLLTKLVSPLFTHGWQREGYCHVEMTGMPATASFLARGRPTARAGERF